MFDRVLNVICCDSEVMKQQFNNYLFENLKFSLLLVQLMLVPHHVTKNQWRDRWMVVLSPIIFETLLYSNNQQYEYSCFLKNRRLKELITKFERHRRRPEFHRRRPAFHRRAAPFANHRRRLFQLIPWPPARSPGPVPPGVG